LINNDFIIHGSSVYKDVYKPGQRMILSLERPGSVTYVYKWDGQGETASKQESFILFINITKSGIL
jgi:hypothetical protein